MQFFGTILTAALHSYRIIRRRIAWLVGNWVGEDLSPSTRTKIYSLLTHLLSRNDSTDTAIRLTAARSLAKCDTWDFDRESFVPFLPTAIEETVSLLGEVELADSRMRLNQTLGVVIDRVGPHVSCIAALDVRQFTHDDGGRRLHRMLPACPKSWRRSGLQRRRIIFRLRYSSHIQSLQK